MRYYPDVLIQIHAMVLVMALVAQNYIRPPYPSGKYTSHTYTLKIEFIGRK